MQVPMALWEPGRSSWGWVEWRPPANHVVRWKDEQTLQDRRADKVSGKPLASVRNGKGWELIIWERREPGVRTPQGEHPRTY